MNSKKRYIEVSFPVKEVGVESAREKNIRHGHISTLHIWWARRPLSSSRATNYAALIPVVEEVEEWEKERDFIIEFSKWENSLKSRMINKARKEILKANGNKPPRVLDPFAGGGAIPLEALRLGCETHACDYNPVASLVLKCTLEYPQKYGRAKAWKENWDTLKSSDSENPLLKDVKEWGEWVLEEARKEIGKFYPEEERAMPVGYIWARTIPCQNPGCASEIPLMRQFWLAKKPKKKLSLYPYVEGNEVKFKIVGDGYEPLPEEFDPSKGTISRAIAVCPVCGSTVDANTTRHLFQTGKAGQRMVAVVLHKPGTRGKIYRVAKEKDMEIFREAEKYLEEKREKLKEEWGIDPVPDEELPPKGTLGFRVQRYGLNRWGDLFNSRQKLALITFTEKVRLAYKKMIEEGYEEEYAKAVVSYLGFVVNKLASWNSVLCPWLAYKEDNHWIFSRQALPMLWDYGERNPFHGELISTRAIINALKNITQIPPVESGEEKA